MAENKWKEADRVSDRIVDMWNEELTTKQTDPIQLLAGFLLAFMALERTMPVLRPASLRKLADAVAGTLSSILAERGV